MLRIAFLVAVAKVKLQMYVINVLSSGHWSLSHSWVIILLLYWILGTSYFHTSAFTRPGTWPGPIWDLHINLSVLFRMSLDCWNNNNDKRMFSCWTQRMGIVTRRNSVSLKIVLIILYYTRYIRALGIMYRPFSYKI